MTNGLRYTLKTKQNKKTKEKKKEIPQSFAGTDVKKKKSKQASFQNCRGFSCCMVQKNE